MDDTMRVPQDDASRDLLGLYSTVGSLLVDCPGLALSYRDLLVPTEVGHLLSHLLQTVAVWRHLLYPIGRVLLNSYGLPIFFVIAGDYGFQ